MLRAGVLESGEKQETDRGTPQGAGISPHLANIFLHDILDHWAHQWRRRHARGCVVIVRYADDLVMGFEKKADAEEMLLALKARLAGFGLTLHETRRGYRVWAVRGPLTTAAWRAAARDLRLPGLHPLLRADPGWPVHREAEDGRETPDAQADGAAWRLMHAPLAAQHRWFAAVLRGHYGYYGRSHNYSALNGFYRQMRRIWLRCLRRRSQKSRRIGWSEFETLTARFPLPTPRITRTWAQARI